MADQPPPPHPNRRRFFRLFAGDVATTLGSMVGVAQTLQQESAQTARAMLTGVEPVETVAPAASTPVALSVGGTVTVPPGGSVALPPASPVGSGGSPVWDATAAGYRAPFRWDGDRALLVDQRQLPDILGEVVVESAADAVGCITDGVIHGGAVQGQLAALTLAIVASRNRESRPFARKATIRGAANAFRLTRPASAAIALATDRMLALLDEMGLEAPGADVAEAMRLEAEAIIAEATEDHGRITQFAPSALPGDPASPLHVLTFGSTGALGSGTFGTALGVITALHHAGRPVHALVAETRPQLIGSRLAAWELRQAGVDHAVVTDAAAAGCIASGEVDVVLVSAERIAANGDVIGISGTYPLALAAAAEGVPFLVCAATSTIDPEAPDGEGATIEEARPGSVLTLNGRRIALEGTPIRNPLQDLTPAALVTAIVTEQGVLRAPYNASIAAAMVTAHAHRAASRGYRALLARRVAAATEAGAPES
jgi:methylthioribose-1-phosphate isomerase